MVAIRRSIGWRYTRRGAMRFLRIGRLQFSWCVCRARIDARRA